MYTCKRSQRELFLKASSSTDTRTQLSPKSRVKERFKGGARTSWRFRGPLFGGPLEGAVGVKPLKKIGNHSSPAPCQEVISPTTTSRG